MSKKSGVLAFDFAGTHGTSWGAVNLCGVVISATTVGHVFLGAPWEWAAGGYGVGVIVTLLWLSMKARGKALPAATIWYHVACWAGAGVWSGWMLERADWTLRGWTIGVGILIACTMVAGVLVGLASDPDADVEVEGLDLDASSQLALNEAGDQYESIVQRLSSRPAPVIRVEEINPWTSGAGHDVVGRFVSGSFGMAELARMVDKVALELDLVAGCSVEVAAGEGGRRSFVMRIGTVNKLAAGAPFPVDEPTAPWTINGPVPVGIQPSGSYKSVRLRERNMLIFGMPGSGKTGGLLATVGSLAYTADAQCWAFDHTGFDLIGPYQTAYQEGRAGRPVFACTSDNADRTAAMMRAALRISYARKMAYQALKAKYKTTLLPMGATVRAADLSAGARERLGIDAGAPDRLLSQIMIMGDETSDILKSRNPEHEELATLIAKAMKETRGSGIRFIFPPLGGDSEYVAEKFQKLTHTVVALKMEKVPEYRYALGQANAIDQHDVAERGQGKMRDEPGAPLVGFRFFGEMTQDVVDQIAIRADEMGSLPELDYVSELAANGYRSDGSPWPVGIEMERSDEGFWAKREGARESVHTAVMTGSVAPRMIERSMSNPGDRDPAPRTTGQLAGEVADLMDRIKEANRATEEAKARAQSGDLGDNEDMRQDLINPPAGASEDEWESLESAAARHWSATPEWLAPIPGKRSWKESVMDMIAAAGPEGVVMGDLVDAAGRHRSTVHEWLAKQLGVTIHQPKTGFYAIIPDEREGGVK